MTVEMKASILSNFNDGLSSNALSPRENPFKES